MWTRLPSGAFVFKGGKAPILDYRLAGSWFTPARQEEILKRFSKVLDHPRLERILDSEPTFSFSGANMLIGDLMHGIIN